MGKYSFSKTKHLLKPEGTYLTTILSFRSVFDILRTRRGKQKSILALTSLRKNDQKSNDLNLIVDLFKNHRLSTVIDKEFPLDHISDAFDYVAQGHKTGNVVINL